MDHRGLLGWTVGGAWEDFRLGLKLTAVGKMAAVIDESWDEWLTRLFRAFSTLTGTGVRFFRADRLEEAAMGAGVRSAVLERAEAENQRFCDSLPIEFAGSGAPLPAAPGHTR